MQYSLHASQRPLCRLSDLALFLCFHFILAWRLYRLFQRAHIPSLRSSGIKGRRTKGRYREWGISTRISGSGRSDRIISVAHRWTSSLALVPRNHARRRHLLACSLPYVLASALAFILLQTSQTYTIVQEHDGTGATGSRGRGTQRVYYYR